MRKIKKTLAVVSAAVLTLTTGSTVVMAEKEGHTTFEFADTNAGEIRGYKYNDVYTFLGVPYAEAERYEEPQEVTPWEGTLNCATYGPVSPQYIAYQNGGNITDFSEYAWADQFERRLSELERLDKESGTRCKKSGSCMVPWWWI